MKASRDTEKPYVQYGCGLCAPPGWRNFDASPTLRLQRLPLIGRLFAGGEYPVFPANVEYGDIVRGLPVAAQTCKAIYCSHVLEHLALEDLRTALAHTYVYMVAGGIFRFVVPDLERLVQEYSSSSQPGAAISFLERSGLGKKTRPAGIKAGLREWLGSGSHLWMWDFKSIAAELERFGFQGVRRAQLGDSEEPRFGEVEEVDRWRSCLGVECNR